MNNPALYVTVNGPQRQDAHDFLDEFRDKLERMSGRILDIGSGPGDVTVDFILPRLNPTATIVCSDISESMVKYAREKYGDNDRIVSFLQLDIGTPDPPADLIHQFDNITSIYCINWCKDMRLAFKNVFSLLRSGGTSFMTFAAGFPPFDCYKHLANDPRYQPYMKDVDRFMPIFQHTENRCEIVKKLMADVGFEVYHCSVRVRKYIFPTHDEFSKFMLAVDSFVGRMPTGLREEYEKDLANESMKYNIPFEREYSSGDECSIPCKYFAFMVYLRKP